MTKIKNTTVLITGGASGIGKLMGKAFLEAGAFSLIIWDINEKALNETVEEFSKDYSEVYGYKVDVCDTKSIEKTAKKVLNELGQIDILVNNAGVVVGKNFEEHTAKDIDLTFQVNVLGVMHCTRVFLGQMMEQKSGHIVNISSASGFIPNPKMSVYASSKWAILGWSESLRLEQEQADTNVKVTTICPSYINTGMFEGVKAPALTPILEPNEVSEAVISAVKKNKGVVKLPASVNLIPILKGVLPDTVFDKAVGEGLGIYNSMEDFKGH